MNFKHRIFLLFCLTIITSCSNDYDILEPSSNASSEIPSWVKETVSEKELNLLDDISKNYKIEFFKPTDEEKLHLNYLLDDVIFKEQLIDLTNDNLNIDYLPVLKTRSENSSDLGRVGEQVYSFSGPSFSTTVTAYFGYTKEDGLLKSINTCDVDHKITGISFVTYFVSQGSTWKIAENKTSIDYLIAGAIRYRVLLADGNLGGEVTVYEFSTRGNVQAIQ